MGKVTHNTSHTSHAYSQHDTSQVNTITTDLCVAPIFNATVAVADGFIGRTSDSFQVVLSRGLQNIKHSEISSPKQNEVVVVTAIVLMMSVITTY